MVNLLFLPVLSGCKQVRNQYKDKQQAQIHCQRLHLKTLPYTLVAEQELLSVSLQFQKHQGSKLLLAFPSWTWALKHKW